MTVFTYALPQEVTAPCDVAVVIDVLRATTTITHALYNGAQRVIAVAQEAQARALHARIPHSLLGGERGGLPPAGFDLGNSPRDYTPQRVQGRTVVLTTSNGTRALQAPLARQAVYVCCLNSLQATAAALRQCAGSLAIVCAGTQGCFSLDDVYTAGALLHALHLPPQDDLSRLALQVYTAHPHDAHAALAHSTHYRKLQALGMQADLDFCLQRDTLPCTCLLGKDGITLATNRTTT